MSDLIQRQILSTKKYKPNMFVSIWDTTFTSAGSSASNQIRLPVDPFNNNYNFVVDWGDGISELITSNTDPKLTHTYAVEGTYTIVIDVESNIGSQKYFIGWRFNNTGDRDKLLFILQWGDIGIMRTGAFYGCSNLSLDYVKDTMKTTVYWDGFFTTFSDMTSVFRNCSTLGTINRINEWDWSVVNNMTNTFRFSTFFNQDLTGLDVSNVTNMNGTFLNCESFNGDISTWDTQNVTNFSNFLNMNSVPNPVFNQPLNNLNLSSCTTINSMFRLNAAFNQNIGNWNVSNVTNATNFMEGKNSSTFSTANLDAIYSGWGSRPVQGGVSINFGTANYTATGVAGRDTLSSSGWNITDGGQV